MGSISIHTYLWISLESGVTQKFKKWREFTSELSIKEKLGFLPFLDEGLRIKRRRVLDGYFLFLFRK
jgi:hypothetical protein